MFFRRRSLQSQLPHGAWLSDVFPFVLHDLEKLYVIRFMQHGQQSAHVFLTKGRRRKLI
jgi:hypothetical protein